MNDLDEYTEAAIQRLLTEHPDLGEQGITLIRREHRLVLSGEVETAERAEHIRARVQQAVPDVELICDIGVIRAAVPTDHEDLS
jgi:hypothetical protein